MIPTPTQIILTRSTRILPPGSGYFFIPVFRPKPGTITSTTSIPLLSSSFNLSPTKTTETFPQSKTNPTQNNGFLLPVQNYVPNPTSPTNPIVSPLAKSTDGFVTNVNNSNIISSVLQEQVLQDQLCGVPGICKSTAIQNCINVTLIECNDCSTTGAGLFVFIIVLLGLAILLGNVLIISASVYLSRKGKATKFDGYKASLAIADLIPGFQIFFVALPNFSWTIHATIDYIRMQQLILRNSAAAIMGSTFFILGFTSSLYHLILLGITRLYAIKWPHHYRSQSATSFRSGIIVVWLLSGLVSSLPGWFPQEFDYDYYHITFLYLPSVNASGTQSTTKAALAMLIILLLIPYLLMTIILIATAVLVRVEMQRNRKHIRSNRTNENSRFTEEEISTFKTVALMQAGFTITLVPLAVTAGLLYDHSLECEDLSTPYLLCLYLSMINRRMFSQTILRGCWRAAIFWSYHPRHADLLLHLVVAEGKILMMCSVVCFSMPHSHEGEAIPHCLVNTVVYSVLEKRFRSSVGEMLKSWKNALYQGKLVTSNNSSHETQPKQVTTPFSAHSLQQL